MYVSAQCRHVVPTIGWVDLYEWSRLHPSFTDLCGASHIDAFWMVCPLSRALQLWLLHTLDTPPSFVCLPCFIWMYFSHWVSIPLGSLACCTFYHTDKASCLLTDTTKKIDTQRFQVSAVMGMSVLGLPIRDCAESCNSSVPRCAKVSTIHMMKRQSLSICIWFKDWEHYISKSNVPMYSNPHQSPTSDFSISVQFFSISRKSRNSLSILVFLTHLAEVTP